MRKIRNCAEGTSLRKKVGPLKIIILEIIVTLRKNLIFLTKIRQHIIARMQPNFAYKL